MEMYQVFRAIPFAALRLLVFDLDGTLIDSRQDLANAVNAMLGALGRSTLPDAVIASYVGDGAGTLVRRALGDPADEAVQERGLTLFLDFYREHKLDHTYVYAGVFAALDRLARAGAGNTQMAVLTNKPVVPSREICEALGLAPWFFAIYGGNSFPTKKPDPEGLRKLMEEAGATPEDTLMIGDSEVDMLTARAAGAWSLGCRYGLAPHTIASACENGLVDAVVDTPQDWPAALGLAQETETAAQHMTGHTWTLS